MQPNARTGLEPWEWDRQRLSLFLSTSPFSVNLVLLLVDFSSVDFRSIFTPLGPRMLFDLNPIQDLLKWELCPLLSSPRIPWGCRSVLQEVPVYKQLKIPNMENRHAELLHDTPHMRSYESRISRTLDFRVDPAIRNSNCGFW